MSSSRQLHFPVEEVSTRLARPVTDLMPLAGDVSVRRFARLRVGPGENLILMVYPEKIREDMDRDFAMMSAFALAGLSPHLVARGDGWFVVADGGESDLADTLANADGKQTESLLRMAVELIPRIQSLHGEMASVNPPLSGSLMDRELAQTQDYYVERLLGGEKGGVTASFFCEVSRRVGSYRRAFSHRDYHVNNILVHPSGDLRLVDVQDARLAPRCYDLVSLLLERATASLPGRLREELLRGAAESHFHLPYNEIREEMLWTGLQRCLKALGTFARQVYRGHEDYRTHLASGRIILADLLTELHLEGMRSPLLKEL